jgi:hypothetical protein
MREPRPMLSTHRQSMRLASSLLLSGWVLFIIATMWHPAHEDPNDTPPCSPSTP